MLFPYLPHTNAWLLIAVLAVIGFCTYGSHILMVGQAAQDFDEKSRGGGLILCTAHNIQVDTPVANIEGLFSTILRRIVRLGPMAPAPT